MSSAAMGSLDSERITSYTTHTPSPLGGGYGEKDMQQSDVVLNRLKSVEGHVRGVERMVEDGVYCIDVIRQIQAVQAALNKISSMILENHLNTCLITAVRGEDPAERERVLTEIAEVFETSQKV